MASEGEARLRELLPDRLALVNSDPEYERAEPTAARNA